MRIHTNLSYAQIRQALKTAKANGRVANDIRFVELEEHGSRKHVRSFDVQLGTWCKTSLPEGYRDQNGHKLNTRRYKNSGHQGASSGCYDDDTTWAATWHEWGWFLAGVFDLDPTAIMQYYADRTDFDRKTGDKFK